MFNVHPEQEKSEENGDLGVTHSCIIDFIVIMDEYKKTADIQCLSPMDNAKLNVNLALI